MRELLTTVVGSNSIIAWDGLVVSEVPVDKIVQQLLPSRGGDVHLANHGWWGGERLYRFCRLGAGEAAYGCFC